MSDYTPLKVNGELAGHPELVSEDCYSKGWMVVFELSDPKEAASLLDAAGYMEHVNASG